MPEQPPCCRHPRENGMTRQEVYSGTENGPPKADKLFDQKKQRTAVNGQAVRPKNPHLNQQGALLHVLRPHIDGKQWLQADIGGVWYKRLVPDGLAGFAR